MHSFFPQRTRSLNFQDFVGDPLARFHCAFHAAIILGEVLSAETDLAMWLAHRLREAADLTGTEICPPALCTEVFSPGFYS